MNSIRSISPVVRAIGVIGAVAVLVTSITYAALQSEVTLTNNTIASATAELQVANTTDDPVACDAFADTAPGFDFKGVVPGGSNSKSKQFCLKNNGDVQLSLAVNATSATWTVMDDAGSGVDNSEVYLNVSCDNGVSVVDTIENIIAGNVNFSGSTLGAGDETVCTAFVSMNIDAFSGSSATSDELDLLFIGVNDA